VTVSLLYLDLELAQLMEAAAIEMMMVNQV
jgi:hypothetical protein